MTRRRLNADDARSLILREAEKLFMEKGYTHATMDELRNRCGMSKGNLYYHYQRKDEIFIQVIADHNDELMDDLTKRVKDIESFYDKLIKVSEIWGLDCGYPLTKCADEFTEDITDREDISDDVINLAMEIIGKTSEFIKSIICEGMKKKAFRDCDPEVAAMSIFSMLQGTSILCLGISDIDVDNYVKIHKENMRCLLDGLAIKSERQVDDGQ